MRRAQPEAAIQRAIFAHIRARGVTGLVALHPANGGYRKPVEAKILAGMGVVAGAPDILAWHDGRAYAMEIKSEDGKLSEAQAEMISRLDGAGVFCAVCYGIDRCLACLESWGLLRGKAV